MTTHTNVPAGWYADPQGTPDLLRWWDGARWTEHTHPGGPGQGQEQARAQAQGEPAAGQQDQARAAAQDQAKASPQARPAFQVPGEEQTDRPGAQPQAGVQPHPGDRQQTAGQPHPGPGAQPQADAGARAGGFGQAAGQGAQPQPQPHPQPQPQPFGQDGTPYGQGQPQPMGGQPAGGPAVGGQPMPQSYGYPQQGPDAAAPVGVPQQAGFVPGGPGTGSLFTEPVLVVNQKAKLIEMTNEYAVFDQHGNAIGTVVQVGQSTAKKVLRLVSSLDQYMTHKLEIRDAYGQPQLVLTRPAKFIKSKVLVERPDGQPVGEIVQQNAIGKINFALVVNGQQIGAIKAENWRAWNFAIVDHADTEIARITKTWEGLAKTMFTTADNYVLQIHQQLPDPLLSLVVATALTVDTALKQDARGFG